MTLAIGVIKGGNVWIGADSVVNGGEEKPTVPNIQPKVWRSNGWIVAGSGLWRALNVVRYTAKLPPVPRMWRAADKIVEVQVIGAIRRALDAAGVEHDKADDDDTTLEWLIGAQDVGLWKISGQTSFRLEYQGAIGCEAFAIGWLLASPIANPARRIEGCIEAAAQFMPAVVQPPIRIEGPKK